MLDKSIISMAAAVSLRAFWKIAARWNLSHQDQMTILGIDDLATFQELQADEAPQVPPEVIIRLSLVLGIFKAINTLLPTPDRADAWLRKPNKAPFLGGESALSHMLSGEIGNLYEVRRYLDSELAFSAPCGLQAPSTVTE
jgi:hypothetical protein